VAEIHVEKKPRSGWIWLAILLLILLIGVLAWLFWPTTTTGVPQPATATTTDATTSIDRSIAASSLPAPALQQARLAHPAPGSRLARYQRTQL
jgi:ABC-type phosphate transport system auxiliary subunit